MRWLGLIDLTQGEETQVPQHLDSLAQAQAAAGGNDALMLRGTLVMEMTLPDGRRPEPLLHFKQDGDWPIELALQAVPGGGLTLVLQQSGQVSHATLNPSRSGRAGRIRLTYAWDSLAGEARIALERADSNRVQVVTWPAPCPWRYRDLRTLLHPGPLCFRSPALHYLALSSELEPVGPTPGLAPETPIATPQGYRRVDSLKRGDLVLDDAGDAHPVLHVLKRSLPGLGLFQPVRLRAPFFGLQQDIEVSAAQRLVLSGSEVEYMFGEPAVLVPARHLVGTGLALPGRGAAGQPGQTDRIVEYCQLVLPDHRPLLAAGGVVESLYLGSLRRDRTRLKASQLAEVDRGTLPEHGPPRYPVLGAFDAAILAERRVA